MTASRCCAGLRIPPQLLPLHRSDIAAARAVPAPGDARRTDHVGGHDQLRTAGLGQRSQRLSLQLARSADRPGLAADAARVRAPGAGRGGALWLSGIRSRRVPDQSLFARQPPHRASRCRRAELRAAHRLRVAGTAREFRVLRTHARRQGQRPWRWSTATCWSGAVRHGWCITRCGRSSPARIR